MEFSQYTTGLAREAANLAMVADGQLDRPVPTCPEWTMADLVRHVAIVYNHKTYAMRHGEMRNQQLSDREDPIAQLRSALGDLLAEFAARRPEETTPTWFDPDQTVGFWMRRMAHETTMHRVDAELAAGRPISPISDELAEDGIDEILGFVLWGSAKFDQKGRTAADLLPETSLVIATPERRRLVTIHPEHIEAQEITDETDPGTIVSADPATVYQWLWRRRDNDAVTITGDREVADRWYRVLEEFGG